MGRFFAINLAVLMGLGLLSMSSAQAQNAYGGVASDTRGEVSIRAPKPSVAKRYAAKIRANYLRHAASCDDFNRRSNAGKTRQTLPRMAPARRHATTG